MAQAHAGRSSRQAGQRFTSLDVLRAAAQIRITDELRNEAIACLALVDLRPVRRFAKWHTRMTASPSMPPWSGTPSATARATSACTAWPTAGRSSAYPGAAAPAGTSGSAPTAAIWSLPMRSGRRAGHWILWDIGLATGAQEGDRTRPISLLSTSPPMAAASPSGCRKPRRPLRSGDWRAAETPDRRSHARCGKFPPRRTAAHVLPRRAGTLRLIDIESGKEVWSHSFEADIDAVAWRGDGRLFAASGSDHRIYVWDMAANRLQSVLEGHQNTVVGLQFTHAGSLLISSSWDGGARIWDPVRGTHLVTLPGGLVAAPTR